MYEESVVVEVRDEVEIGMRLRNGIILNVFVGVDAEVFL